MSAIRRKPVTPQQWRIDNIVADYLKAHETSDYVTLADIWGHVHLIPGLEDALHQLHEDLLAEQVAA